MSAAPPALPAKPTAAPVAPTLRANGLIERSLHQIGVWAGDLGHQLDQARHSFIAIFDLLVKSGGHIANDTDRQLLLQVGTALLGVFITCLLLEWLCHLALKRPLQALIAKANAVEQRDRTRAGTMRTLLRSKAHLAQKAKKSTVAQTKTDAGVRPASGDVALVHVNEQGVDRVEPVRVGAQNSASGAQPESASNDALSSETPTEGDPHARPARHANTLHHLLFAFGAMLLNLIPLCLFIVASGLVLRGLGGDDDRVSTVVGSFIDAYVSTRIIMAIVRLFVSPEGQGLCVLRASERTTKATLTWMRCMVILAAFGMAAGDAIDTFGGGEAGRLAFIKLVSLFVHAAAVALILKLRYPLARAISAAPDAHGIVAASRNWLAKTWAVFAIAFVVGAWVIWALGVEDGFSKLIHFLGVSAAVLIAARLAAILAQGALGRLFHTQNVVQMDEVSDARGRLVQRYYPIIHGLVSFFITILTIVALLQAWGLDAVGWFAHGAVGRSLTSAALTILVATVIAISVWEAASFSIERRIYQWTERGDLMRAARLRTLLPMMRTCLLIAVVLIVGLTALNEIGINTTPLLAGASIIGVALGFGSQKLVQDFITGIFLMMENAMQVGDWVTVAGVSGTVEYLSVRTVRLRGGDGSLYTIPFSSVTTVNNVNRGVGNAAMSVSIAYGEDVERAIDELTAIGKEMRSDTAFQKLILKDLEIWGVDAVDGSKITIAGQMQCTDKGRWGVQREFNRRIEQRFRDVGIELANPRTSYLFTQSNTNPPAKSSAK
ncbi:mechanosensitive ion channel domain-containing protein [Dyella sp. 2HG41-7]|uniref:mechanosensitive ion channel family protein n=1 Tax=Dyella sp. 2HG41-7 TaxID=2883239 RepID=UPI001F298E9B|nr:mechanosensitive ion channel domain-containing protein [Dyella sp. 2HG41-7]